MHVPPTHSTDHRDCVGTAAPLRGARGHVDVSSSHAIVTRVATSASRAGLSLYRFTLPFVIDCGCEQGDAVYRVHALHGLGPPLRVALAHPPLLSPLRVSQQYSITYPAHVVTRSSRHAPSAGDPTTPLHHLYILSKGASAPIPPPRPPAPPPPYGIVTPMSMISSSRLLLVFASPLSCISRALARCSSVSMHVRGPILPV